ncbi:MAG: TolC family protein, partial [Pseudoxanthomonas sp.]
AVVSARAAYEASQVGLEVGTRTVLDVLINQQTLFDAQQLYALSKYNYLQNRLLLDQAAGTLDGSDVQEVNRFLTVDANTQLEPTAP